MELVLSIMVLILGISIGSSYIDGNVFLLFTLCAVVNSWMKNWGVLIEASAARAPVLFPVFFSPTATGVWHMP